MMKIRWANCVLALALAALPAFAEDEGEAGTEALATESEVAEAAPEASSEPLSGRVTRAGFTTGVIDREPQDSITSLPSDVSQILFFTEFSGLEGHTLTHVWERDGIEMARVPFAVGGSRWRVYSTKNLEPSGVGEWKVSVVDEEDRVLRSESFSYVAAEVPPAAEEAAAPSEEPAAGEAAAPSEEPSEEPAVPAAIE
jgi:hypothetical protein